MSSALKEFGKLSVEYLTAARSCIRELCVQRGLFDYLNIGRWTLSVGDEGELSIHSPDGMLVGRLKENRGETSTVGALFESSSKTPKAWFRIEGGCVEVSDKAEVTVDPEGGATYRVEICCFSREGGSLTVSSGGEEVTVDVPAAVEWKGPWTDPLMLSSTFSTTGLSSCTIEAIGSVYVRHMEVF